MFIAICSYHLYLKITASERFDDLKENIKTKFLRGQKGDNYTNNIGLSEPKIEACKVSEMEIDLRSPLLVCDSLNNSVTVTEDSNYTTE